MAFAALALSTSGSFAVPAVTVLFRSLKSLIKEGTLEIGSDTERRNRAEVYLFFTVPLCSFTNYSRI